MLAINVSMPNGTVARLEHFRSPQLYESRERATNRRRGRLKTNQTIVINAPGPELFGHGSREKVDSAAAVGLRYTDNAPVRCFLSFFFRKVMLKHYIGVVGKQSIVWFPTFSITHLPKNYRNRIVHVKIITSQRWDVFETQRTMLLVQATTSPAIVVYTR